MAHPLLDHLLELLTSTATRMLTTSGEFLPFAAAASPEGQTFLWDTEPSEHTSDVTVLLEALRTGLGEAAVNGEIAAAGVCVDSFSSLPGRDEPTDALEIELEHSSGESFLVYYPYERTAADEVVLGEPTVLARRGRYWPRG